MAKSLLALAVGLIGGDCLQVPDHLGAPSSSGDGVEELLIRGALAFQINRAAAGEERERVGGVVGTAGLQRFVAILGRCLG